MASRNRGRPKLRDLSRTPPTAQEQAALRGDFNKNQPPIVTAVLGQSLLEIELDQLLRPHFKHHDDATWAKLTDDHGPFSNFNSKIISARAFGICNDVVRDGLNTVRNIRNAFAHSNRPLKFSHELVVKELKNITLPKVKRSSLCKSLSVVQETSETGE